MGMAQQLLNGAQLHSPLQHQNGKRVAQHMRSNIGDTGLTRVVLDNKLIDILLQPPTNTAGTSDIIIDTRK
jgi:hypothetical protein